MDLEVLDNLIDLQNVSGGQSPEDFLLIEETTYIPHEAFHVVQQ